MNGRLLLSTSARGGKTYTDDLYFTPPYKLYSPFYENGFAKYILMSASAGVLAGDENSISLDIKNGSRVIFTDQGYQKLFNTNGEGSSQKLCVRAENNSFLIYMPHPVMTFGGCRHYANNRFELSDGASLIFSEIYCCGRTAMGERFALDMFRSRTEILIDSKLDFLDNTLIDPKRFPMAQKGFFEGYTHTGFMYIHISGGICEELIEACTETELCISRTVRGAVVRALGHSGEELYDRFLKIADMVRAYLR